MDDWIKDTLAKLDRSSLPILFGEHAAKDKNLTIKDVDLAVRTVKFGKVDNCSSTQEKQRICFKSYSKQGNLTYFVVTECGKELIKIITVIKKKGKH
jgi:uncharacterized DUF497 family protein